MLRIVALCWVALLRITPTHAQSSLPESFIPALGTYGPCDFKTGKLHFDCIPIYIGYLIKFLSITAGGFLIVNIIIAGYKYAIGSVTTAGKEEGKKQLAAAIIGFCVAVLSYLLVDTVIEALT